MSTFSEEDQHRDRGRGRQAQTDQQGQMGQMEALGAETRFRLKSHTDHILGDPALSQEPRHGPDQVSDLTLRVFSEGPLLPTPRKGKHLPSRSPTRATARCSISLLVGCL